MSRLKRREIPEIFGTSLIDLLVGGLTLVSILWVLNSLNSGYKGRGEVDSYSAFASVSQFGANHLTSVRIEQAGKWSCECEREPDGFLICSSSCSTTSNITSISIPVNGDGVGIKVTHEDGKKLEKPLSVLVRILPEDERFTGGVQINVDNLINNIKVTLKIDACCSSDQPHYVRVLRIAPGMEEKDLLLWHNSNRLRCVLSSSNNISWISDFKKQARKYFNKQNIMGFDLAAGNSTSCEKRHDDCLDDTNRIKVLELEFDEDEGISMKLPMTSRDTPNLNNHQDEFLNQLKRYSNATP